MVRARPADPNKAAGQAAATCLRTVNRQSARLVNFTEHGENLFLLV